MKYLILFALLVTISVAESSPFISDVKCRQRRHGYAVTYRLSGESAVVTADFCLNGELLPANSQTNVSGDVNALVHVGNASFSWMPPASFEPPESPAEITVSIRAWSTTCPPAYIVVDLRNPTAGAKYYASVDRLPAPISASCWRTDFLVMRKIPAACIEWRAGLIGASNSFEARQRFVTLSRDYYLGVFPVTIGQYRNMSEQAGAENRSDTYLTDFGIETNLEWPKGQLSYEYLRGRRPIGAGGKKPGAIFWPASGHESIDGTADLAKFRATYGIPFDLPSEAEWEFACRGGIETNTVVGLVGATLDDVAWYADNSAVSVTTNGGQAVTLCLPHRVGEKQPNAYGLYDMLGNIYEFCLDWYDESPDVQDRVLDPSGPIQNPVTEGSGVSDTGFDNPYRVRRGGSFAASASVCRPSAREGHVFTWDAGGSGNGLTSMAKYQNGLRLWASAEAIK